MELMLKSKLQHQIADLLWAAETQEAADQIVQQFGRDGEIVMNLMLAAGLDEVMDVDLARTVLSQFQ